LKTTTLKCNSDGVRLDVFLAKELPGLTRSAAQKLLEAGSVTIGDTPMQKNHKTFHGEIYTIIQNEPVDCVAVAQNIRLDIMYEDADIIVVNKPRGLVVHPAPGHSDGTLVNALLYHCGDSLSGIGGVFRPGIVHRIDKDTSGLIIAAKNDRAHLSLASQLSARTLIREYETIVLGNIKTDSGTIDVPIGRHPTDRKKQTVFIPGKTTGGSSSQSVSCRHAVTHFEIIARYKNYSHVRCKLETGRTHQIRVHLAHIGHPVLGDVVYGRKCTDFNINGQCLHARRLQFLHPSSGNSIDIWTDLPEYFSDIITKLEKRTF